MTRLQAAGVWIAALAVFLVLCPISGMDQRAWAEAVFAVTGTGCAVLALSAASLPLAVFSLWLVVVAVLHPSLAALSTIAMVLALLGVFALATKHGGVRILRVIVALNLVVMALQAAGAWHWLLRLAFPAATYTIFNTMRPVVGLTSSTGDLACVLAMALPFCFSGRWTFLCAAGIFALCSTSALSGIVAGMAGLFCLAWPWITRQVPLGVALSGVGLMSSTFLLAGWGEITSAWTDTRWHIWADALSRWVHEAPLVGHGLGSWRTFQEAQAQSAAAFHSAAVSAGVFVTRDTFDAWDQLHFDLLQLGYEGGLVGVTLVALVFAWAVMSTHRSGNRPALAGLAALGICQFGHFPFHLAAPSVVAALVLGEAHFEGNRRI